MARPITFFALAGLWTACGNGGASIGDMSGSGGGAGSAAAMLGKDGSVGAGGMAFHLDIDAVAAPPLASNDDVLDLVVERRGPASTVPGELLMVVRDFKFYDATDPSTNPDFENPPQTDEMGTPNTGYTGPWDDKEIVEETLGADYKPVYKNRGTTPAPPLTTPTLTTHGEAFFNQWYRTVDGTNIAQQIPLTLTRNAAGFYSYDSLRAGPPLSPGGGFFPIDDGTPYATTFGDQGRLHNYSFTVEIHTLFTYTGGEVFNFSGDDDVFVFIDNRLVINLGGIHGREPMNVTLDTLGLTKGQSYPLDFFSAERHVSASNLLITTTLELLPNPGIPIF